MESPIYDHIPVLFNGNFSLTCTYHRESDLPCTFGFYAHRLTKYSTVHYVLNRKTNSPKLADYDIQTLLHHKSRMVLWMYSNCRVKFRKAYANQLMKAGVDIDIFGKCTRPDPCKREYNCLTELYKKYKCYLAFENSHCYDYITEKTWKTLKMEWFLLYMVLQLKVTDITCHLIHLFMLIIFLVQLH